MAALDPVPLPPELAASAPDADAWLERTIEYAVAIADEAALDADDVGAGIAEAAAAGEADDELGLPEPARRWTVTNTADAEWALRLVAVADDELRTLRAQADEWAGRIASWFASAAKPHLATKGLMEAHLKRYALQRRADNPKAKTLSLPAGRVQTTYTAPKVEVADADAVVAWAEASGLDDVVRVKKEPRVSDLREHVTIGPWYVGIRLVLDCGHTDLQPDSAYPPPEVGDEFGACGQCRVAQGLNATATVADVVVHATYDVALYPDPDPDTGELTLRRVLGTYVAPAKVTAKVKAERP